LLGEVQVAQVPRVHDVEDAMAHDHALLARPGADDGGDLLHRLDLVAIVTPVHASTVRRHEFEPRLGGHGDRVRVPHRRVRPGVDVAQHLGDAVLEADARGPSQHTPDPGGVRPGAVRLAGPPGQVYGLAADQLG